MRLLCPYCHTMQHSIVTDVRPSKTGPRRRRRCGRCQKMYSTLEVDLTMGLAVNQLIDTLRTLPVEEPQ
jgi:transcriptional regulator NrdR family protein